MVENRVAHNFTAPNMLVKNNILFNITHNDTGLQVGMLSLCVVCVSVCLEYSSITCVQCTSTPSY